MKSKLIAIGMATALAVGSIGIACANPITNGTFGSTTPTQTTPTQFGSGSGSCGMPGRTWGGQFVDGWTENAGYGIWYPSASAASGVQACTQYGATGNQYLPAAVTAPPTGTSTFLGLDGQEGIRASISQQLSGLINGGTYVVDFYWASTQELSRNGPTTEQFKVSLGGSSKYTGINSIGTHGWADWQHESFAFRADSSNPVLTFLSVGTPGNLPPFALLSDVSMRHVPEPSELGLFGLGLFGLGLLTLGARYNALHRRHAGNNDDIA